MHPVTDVWLTISSSSFYVGLHMMHVLTSLVLDYHQCRCQGTWITFRGVRFQNHASSLVGDVCQGGDVST